jgi:hypothetical protein
MCSFWQATSNQYQQLCAQLAAGVPSRNRPSIPRERHPNEKPGKNPVESHLAAQAREIDLLRVRALAESILERPAKCSG